MEMRDVPDPLMVHDDDVLIRMKSIGVCGSDVHYYTAGRIGSQVVKFPFTLGHEGSGIVEEVGPEVQNVSPGDRIAFDPSIPCYKCDQCLAGRHHTCRNILFMGCPDQYEGCLSEFIIIPSSICYPLDENISFDQAALSEPLSIGVYSAMLGGNLENSKIAILGSGPIGVSVMLSAVQYGASKVYMTDLLDERLKLARSLGAHWTGNSDEEDIVDSILGDEPLQLDVVFECCGKQEALNQAVKLLKPGGRLVIVGVPLFDNWIIGTDEMRKKELSIQNVRRQNEALIPALEFISSGKIKPERMMTHTFSFDRVAEAYDLVAGYRDGVMKAMINF